jgi:hypothetical protein
MKRRWESTSRAVQRGSRRSEQVYYWEKIRGLCLGGFTDSVRNPIFVELFSVDLNIVNSTSSEGEEE